MRFDWVKKKTKYPRYLYIFDVVLTNKLIKGEKVEILFGGKACRKGRNLMLKIVSTEFQNQPYLLFSMKSTN